MTYSLSNNCTKNYYNRTLTVQVIVEDVVTWIFLKHSVDPANQRVPGLRPGRPGPTLSPASMKPIDFVSAADQ